MGEGTTLAFNWTKVELKLKWTIGEEIGGVSFNWTKVELKLGGSGSDKDINTRF